MTNRIPGGFHAIACVLRPIATPAMRKDWRGGENLQVDGGYIAVSNHMSPLDPLTLAYFLYNNGQAPHFLAKASLFDIPVAGWLMHKLDQIPVYRGTKRARDAIDAGAAALDRGDMIAMFPEGTLTKDPDGWPMHARPGAARMALEQNVPVIPVAQWGVQDLLDPRTKKFRPIPPKKITIVAGPPVDLDEFRDKPIDAMLLRAATTKIMASLTSMLEEIRGESAPETPFDTRDGKREI